MIRKMMVLVFLLAAIGSNAQPASKEVAVSDLSGETKCAYQSFIRIIRSNIIFPDSTVFAPKIDLLNMKKFYVIGCYADARSEMSKGNVKKVKMYYQLKLQKLSDDKNCNSKDWKVLGMAFVNHKNETTLVNDIYMAAAEYDKADFLSSDAAFVKKKDKWGLMDKNGNLLIPVQYDSLAVHSLGVRALLNGKWNIIDYKTGEQKTRKNYSKISSSFPRVKEVRLAAVEYEGKQGFINQQYEEIVPTIYTEVNILANRFATGTRNGKTVLLSEITGKELTPLKYDIIRYQNDHMLIVGIRKTETFGLIDGTGKELLAPVYSKMDLSIGKGVFAAAKEGKYALMNITTMTPFTDFKYDVVRRMFGDTIMVKINGKWGAINTKDEVVIPIKFDKGTDSWGGEYSFTLGEEKVLFKEGRCVQHCELLKKE